MKIKLTKISRPEGLPGGLRTDVIVGESQGMPKRGKSFTMEAEPLNSNASFRYVNTSIVMQVVDLSENVKRFTTKSGSVYELEVL